MQEEEKTKIEINRTTANTLKSRMEVGDTYDSVIQDLLETEKKWVEKST